MRATGVVRRIDDLGRIVIPKEIRRTMRMREGDPLEIFTGAGGEIIFKKYSIMAELSQFSQSYAESLYRVSGMHCVVFDSDRVVAFTGQGKKDVVGLACPGEIEDLLSQRQSYFRQYKSEKTIPPFVRSEYCVIGATPIIASGDGVGVVALVGSEGDVLSDAQKKLLVLTATFLANHLEI
ncbi:MAG: AbrB/MazE/SpoVT family DNA-binding domain-containing protein [Oscillospiraceae bacterium]|nr:AbrB/MazE/SpoVT family DNA-binding domain-containing protein [Oscillospiraceae bacterium]MBR5251607.1 AbrB/MazE/SpoVT family DNA-binding domain-containing protein [Oscillospiraceae bacterium]